MATSRFFKLSGMIHPDDRLHQVELHDDESNAPNEHFIAPKIVVVKLHKPVVIDGKTYTAITVPQYSDTVRGGKAAHYDPAGDCNGNFMSYKFQPNNNCYAYGTNIATNSFAQPGRKSGYLLTSEDQVTFEKFGEAVRSYAEKDGLIYVGTTKDELLQYKSDNFKSGMEGHFTALLISPRSEILADKDLEWPGDYHWVRCDNSSEGCDSWSQKDGNDQVTNFDFAGNLITDPATANWTVNQGPPSIIKKDKDGNEYIAGSKGAEFIVEYGFYCYMFVPDKGVDII